MSEKKTVATANMPAVGVGRNVQASIEGGRFLVLKIDLQAPGVRSQKGTGPNLVIASTGGNVQVPGCGGAKLGLNFYTPA